MESRYGIRYSELFRLPYFDPIRSHAVDPMHNLFSGTAKHTFAVWVQLGILNDEKLKDIDRLMKNMIIPSEVGRIVKSMSLFKSMKADEWKNWVVHYSLFCLKGLIGRNHYNMWQIFVRACKLLINTSISMNEAKQAHDLLLLFCNTFQNLLGADHCTPNMHMHLHILSCIENHGPIYGFWCYSFERFNGIMGNFHTNNHALTITLMKKFINGARVISSYYNLNIEGLPLLSYFNITSETKNANTEKLDEIQRFPAVDFNLEHEIYKPLSVALLESLTVVERDEINLILVNRGYFDWELPRFVYAYSRVRLGRDVLSSSCYRRDQNRDKYIIVKGPGVEQRPAIIKKIITIPFTRRCDGNKIIHLPFLKITYFKEHPEKAWFGINCPMQLWSTEFHAEQYVPLRDVLRKCAISKGTQRFNRIDLGHGKRSRVKASDTVYFVI